MKNEILEKPNNLISILPKEKISLIQQKTYNIFLKKVQEEIKFDDEEINKKTKYLFEIPCNELKKRAGLGEKNYNRIKKELKKLIQIIVEVVDKENKENWAAFSLLESVEKTNNVFEFSLDWRIVKALKKSGFFTKVNLLQIKNLTSRYSVILYELAKRYYSENENIKIPRMTIKELRTRTNTQNKYKRTNDLLRLAIDPACEEISEKTDIILYYEKIKKGRRIAYIDFKVEKKEIIDIQAILKEGEELLKETDRILEDASKSDQSNNNFDDKNKDDKNKSVVQLSNQESKTKKYNQEVLDLFELLPKDEQIDSNREVLKELLKKYEYKYIKADINHAKKFADKNFIGFLKASCEAGHWGKYELEKEEQRKEQARKKREEEERKKKAQKEMEKKVEELAFAKIENLTNQEREVLKEKYDCLRNANKNNVDFTERANKMWADDHNFEEYLIKHFKAQVEDVL